MESTHNQPVPVARKILCYLAFLLLAVGLGQVTVQAAQETRLPKLELATQPADQLIGKTGLSDQGTIPLLKVIEGTPERALLEAEPLGKEIEERAQALANGTLQVRAETAKVDDLYLKWASANAKQGGDHNLRLVLGTIRGLMPAGEATGKAWVDLVDAKVRIEIESLRVGVDLWLVDNQSGHGRSALPEAGDRYFRLGHLEPLGDVAEFSKNLDGGFFDRFELDLLVVTPAGIHPKDEMMLLGTPSTFQRRFTRERRGVSSAPAGAGGFSDPRVALGLVSQQVLEGGDLFFRGTFEGNGRSCGTCHPPAFNLVIDPDFIARQRRINPNDPLFIADPGRPNGVPLEIPDILERFALIFENVDGFEDPGNKFMMRSVPHNISSALSVLPPGDSDGDGVLDDGTTNDVFAFRTGWSGDGAPSPGGLRAFPLGAVVQHYTRDFNTRFPSPQSFRLQTEAELDRLEAFLLSTGRLNELDLSVAGFTDSRAERGRQLFTTGVGGAKCFGCHNNAGGNSAFGGNRNFNTGIETVRIAELNARGIPCDGGFGGQGNVPPNNVGCAPGSAGGRGNGSFNVMPLAEAADTPPFFHTNAFNTIEEAVGFYSTPTFANSQGGAVINSVFGEPINLTAQQTNDVAAFLRVLNSSFNLQQSLQRIEAAQQIGGVFGLSQIQLTNNLLILANNELVDAFFDLRDRGLNGASQSDIFNSIFFLRQVLRSGNPAIRAFNAELARAFAARADSRLGSGIAFDIGEGNLLF